jgi:hypothetical protein
MIRCDFCGLEFDPACNQTSCTGCPLANGCAHITCPRCGYVILPEAKLVGWLRGVSLRLRKTARPGDLLAVNETSNTGKQR